MNEDCIFSKAIDLVIGLMLLAAGVFFLISGMTIFPYIGFLLAIPILGGSALFLKARRDPSCMVK
jgi:hypothetical protein